MKGGESILGRGMELERLGQQGVQQLQGAVERSRWRPEQAGPGSPMGASQGPATTSAGQGEGVGLTWNSACCTYCQFCSLLCFWCLEQCLAQNSCSINRHWVNI